MNIALIIFVLSYTLVAFQNIPKLHINRPAGALLGATAMVLCGVLTLDEAYAAINMDTLLFVLGMMIIIAYVEASGFFEITENFILTRARTPSALLFLIIFSSGILSSIFMNDTVCIMFTPLVLRLVKRTRLNPIPYLIGLATSSNVGSVMTIIGNPQNMLIGIYSKIHFLEFLKILCPVTIIGLMINFFVIRYVYRKDIHSRHITLESHDRKVTYQGELLIVSSIAIVLLVTFLSLGFHPPGVAVSTACFVILAGAAKPRKTFERVDWALLLVFAGLFVIMKGVEKSGLTALFLDYTKKFLSDGAAAQVINLTVSSTIISNIVSNVPAVLLFGEVFSHVQNSRIFWLTLAMSSTLAGNLTIIGSVANIIVFESARDVIKVGFFEYMKTGILLTILTLAIGVAVLLWWC